MKISFTNFALALSTQLSVLHHHQANAFTTTATVALFKKNVPAFASSPRTATNPCPYCLYAAYDDDAEDDEGQVPRTEEQEAIDQAYKNNGAYSSIPGKGSMTEKQETICYDDDAEDDGGQVPTTEEQEAIDKACNNVYLTRIIEDDMYRDVIGPIEDAIKGIVPDTIASNGILFEILKQVSGTTSITDPVDLTEDIDFVKKSDTKECMFFQVKSLIDMIELGIMRFYKAINSAPSLNLDIDTDNMTEEDYDNIIGDHASPLAMMEVESPLKCFVQNAPAFCRPIDGEEHKSVCNLNYLEQYQVRKGTTYQGQAIRYGGSAIVEKGDIVEISGVKKGEEEFDKMLNIFLASFGVHVVLVRHAVMGHLAMYQKYMMKLTVGKSKAYQELWKKHKSPKFLMKALTPRATNLVNFKIQILIGTANSLVGRATSFTDKSIMHLNTQKYNEYAAMDPNEMVEYIGSQGSKGWKSACHTSWEAAQEVVNFICRDIKDSDELKGTDDLRDLAMLLWTGTFFHGFIGDFQLDNVNRGNLPFILTGKKHQQSVAYGTLSTTIGTTTSQRTMDMRTLSKFFGNGDDCEAWDKYHHALAECATMTNIEGFSYDNAVYNAIDF